MNLHAIVTAAISIVNPPTQVTLLRSNGYVTNEDGSRQPSYDAPVTFSAQVQELTQPELAHTEGMNLQGLRQASVYFNGAAAGLVRTVGKGGDLMRFRGAVWLVTAIMEDWSATSGWIRVGVVMQNPHELPWSDQHKPTDTLPWDVAWREG